MGEREKGGKKGFFLSFLVYVLRIRFLLRNTYTYYVYIFLLRITYTYYVYVLRIRFLVRVLRIRFLVRVLRIRFLVRVLRIRFSLGSGGAWVKRIRFSYGYYVYVILVLRIYFLLRITYTYYVYVFRRSKGRTGFGAFPRTPYIINVLPLRTYKSGFLVLFATQK